MISIDNSFSAAESTFARPQPAAWAVQGLGYSYPGSSRAAVENVSITLASATCTAILGPNGSGKSTLLRLLLGTLRPATGEIIFQDRPLEKWSRRELARSIGVVPQDEEIAFPITVRELVEMGRYAHLGPYRFAGEADRRAVDAALLRCDVTDLQDRALQTLSGGERQRARLARALAQEPAILALDEPTRALDMRHEMEILELIRGLVAEGTTVVIVTHNINLAARYADELLLMDRGSAVAMGPVAEVVRRDLFEEVYRWPVALSSHPGPGRDTGIVQITPLSEERSR